MRRQYRAGARFVLDLSQHTSVLDRNAKARIMHGVEALEKVSRRKGCQNGSVGRPGVAILRVLLFRFSNHATGLCFPSLRTIAKATGYSKQAVVASLKKLEMLGVVTIVRRLVKARDAVGNLYARQASSLYSFSELGRLTLLPLPEAKARAKFGGLRVNAMGRSNQTGVKIEGPKPFWMKDVGFRGVGAAKFGTGINDWRDRSRKLLQTTV
jgi:Helix-turn-helix domain